MELFIKELSFSPVLSLNGASNRSQLYILALQVVLNNIQHRRPLANDNAKK